MGAMPLQNELMNSMQQSGFLEIIATYATNFWRLEISQIKVAKPPPPPPDPSRSSIPLHKSIPKLKLSKWIFGEYAQLFVQVVSSESNQDVVVAE